MTKTTFHTALPPGDPSQHNASFSSYPERQGIVLVESTIQRNRDRRAVIHCRQIEKRMTPDAEIRV